jgi:hypothetical protein
MYEKCNEKSLFKTQISDILRQLFENSADKIKSLKKA